MGATIYIYIFFPFSLFVSVCVYASVCDFVCIALLLPFVLGFYLSVFFFAFWGFFSILFSTCYHSWICFLVWLLSSFFISVFFLNNFFIFYFNHFILFYFILFYLLLSFSLFFLPYILNRVNDRLLVLQPGVRAVPLRWESQDQDTGPQETSQLHVISNGKSLPEISISMPRLSSTRRPASYSTGHPMPNN